MNSTAGAPFTYALVAGIGDDNNPSFEINGDMLITARPLDFEARSSLTVRVRSTDAGGASVEKVYPISVINNNDAPSCTSGPPQDTTDESSSQSVPGWLKNCLAGAPDETEQELSVALTVDRSELFTTPPALDEFGTLTYDAAPNARGTAIATVTVQDNGGTANGGVDLSTMIILFDVAKPHPWHNSARPFDVSGGLNGEPDGHIVAGDALEIINYLNAFGAQSVPEEALIGTPFGFLDTGGEGGAPDNFVTAGDALDVINFLNAGLGGEGESVAAGSETNIESPRPADTLDELINLIAADETGFTGRRRTRP